MKRSILLFVCCLFLFSTLFLVDARGEEVVLSSMRWDTDIRIGDRDSVNSVAFDVDHSTGNLFVVLKNTENGTDYWSVNVSTDTGRTWTETGFMGPDIRAVDGVVFQGHFYVVYTTWTTVLIRRFGTDDGAWDGTYGTDTVITAGMGINEIALASTQDFSPPTRLYCFIIRNGGYLNYLYSNEDISSWDLLPIGVDNADRGLDACCNEGYSSEYVWCSYIGTNDSVYIGSVGSTWNSYGPLTDASSIGGFDITSIGAYRDTVMVLYPIVLGEFSFAVRSCASYDGGNNWSYEGTVYVSALNRGASDITARKGDGFGVVVADGNFGLYTHRDYPPGDWSDTVHFTNPGTIEQGVKLSIERIAINSYGIVYVNSPTMGAYFDISQWPEPGIEEKAPGQVLLSVTPSIFSSGTSVECFLPTSQNISLDVYDVLGNHVKTLASGTVPAGSYSADWDGKDEIENPVASGIFFCVLKTNTGAIVEKMTLLR